MHSISSRPTAKHVFARSQFRLTSKIPAFLWTVNLLCARTLAKTNKQFDFGWKERNFPSPAVRAPKNNGGLLRLWWKLLLLCRLEDTTQTQPNQEVLFFLSKFSSSYFRTLTFVQEETIRKAKYLETLSRNIIILCPSSQAYSYSSIFASFRTMFSSRLPQVLRQSRSLRASLCRTFSSECAPAQKLREVFEDYRQTQNVNLRRMNWANLYRMGVAVKRPPLSCL